MANGINGSGPDPRDIYADIIDHPHWVSPAHPPMSLYDRAAQFSPYAALVGYEDMISEEARTVDNRIELGEEALEELNQRLNLISKMITQGSHPEIMVTYFIPDPLKSGGIYETLSERVRRVDAANGIIQLARKVTMAGSYLEIRIEDILNIQVK